MRTRPNANGRRKPPPDAARRRAPSVTRQTHAIIAGAGIGGLAAAIALARAGLRVTLIERAPVLGEAGAGLQLAPNATGRLREMGLLDKILKYATAPEALRIRRARDGRELARLPLGPIADFRWGAPYLVIHRADLQRALMEACAAEPAISLRAGVRVTGFAVAGDRVEIGAREGEAMTRFDGDFLVGADGLRSVVRERLGLGPSDAPVWSGRTAWRALVPAAAAPPVARRVETNLWLGPRAHLVHYPVRHGEFVNVVAIAEDGWRGEDTRGAGGRVFGARMAALAAVRPRAVGAMARRQGGAARRRRPSHVAVFRAGRGAGDRGRGGAGRGLRRAPRRREWRARGL